MQPHQRGGSAPDVDFFHGCPRRDCSTRGSLTGCYRGAASWRSRLATADRLDRGTKLPSGMVVQRWGRANREASMKTVAIYARYSTDLQDERSIADQINACKDRVQREGWKV